MKTTLFQWLIILLIAGGIWYFVSEKKGGGIESVLLEDEEETSHKEVKAGTYVIFQKTELTDKGSMDWSKDDTHTTTLYRVVPFDNEPVAFATILADETWSGSVWSEAVGRWILVHRYLADASALLEPDGIVISVGESLARIASADGRTAVDYTFTFDNRAATLTMDIGGTDPARIQEIVDNGGTNAPVEIEPAELGITLGYAEPFVVSDDGNSVYLRQVFEGEGCNINGLWLYDVTTGEMQKLSVVADLNLQDYHVSPTTQQLIGVGYKLKDDPEAIGPSCGKPDGPRSIYLVDLKTGAQQILAQDDELIYYHLMLSDDGTQYAYQLNGSEDVWIGPVDGSQAAKDIVPGYALDWFGDTLVMDYGDVLSLYDLASGTSQALGTDTGPDNRVDYVGHVTVK